MTLPAKLWRAWAAGFSLACGATISRGADAADPPNPRFLGTLPNQEWSADETGGGTQNYSVVQAPDTGGMYFGNLNGVLEYDGARWRLLPWIKERTTGNLPVRGIVVDERGRLWAGTDNDLVRYAPDAAGRWKAESMVERLPAAERRPGIIGRVLWRDGVVWGVSADRVVRFDTQGTGARSWPLENGLLVRGIVDDEPWFFRPGGTLVRLKGDAFTPAAVPALPATALPLLAVSRTPAGTLEAECARGVLELRGDAWVQQSPALAEALQAGGGASSVVRRPDGGRVFGSDAGWLLLVDAAGQIQARLGPTQGIRFRGLHRTWLDRDGGLWIAGTAGIWRVQLDAAVARHGATQGLLGGVNRFTHEGGTLWVVTDQGWFSRDARTGRFERHIVANDLYCALRDPAGGWLLGGGPAQPLRTWSERGEARVPVASGGVLDLARDPRDPMRVFAASQNAVHVLRRGPDGWKLEANLTGMTGTMAFVAVDATGALWASPSRTEGLWRARAPEGDWTRAKVERVDGPGGAQPDLPAGAWRVAIVAGELILGSSRGIWRLAPANGRVELDPRFAGLPAGAATAVGSPLSGADADHVVFVIGSQSFAGRAWRGVRGARDEAWRFTEMPMADFKAARFVRWSGDLPDGKTYWIGTDRDLISVDLATAPEVPAAQARWRMVGALEGDEVFYGGAGERSALALPRAQRAVRLEYATASLRVNADGVSGTEYRSRASGVDRAWSAWTKAPMRELTNLPPGDVALEVQARNYRGVAGPVATLTLAVPPFWWETWWWRGSIVLAGALLVAGIARALVRRQYQQRIALLEAQAAVQQERVRIARDMHDDLGSTLANLVHLSDGSAGRAAPPDATLERIHTTTRDLVQRTRDLVWAATPEHDSLESLAEQLVAHAERTLGDRGVDVRAELPPQIPPEAIAARARHDLFLAFKEAVNNCAKYAQAKTVRVRVELTPDALAVALADDGVGFAPGAVQGTGHGLNNLRARLAALGGSATIVSAAGQGTTVTLRLPRQKS
jgi:signal transduction histidine kinase